jgi:hypothetical protein
MLIDSIYLSAIANLMKTLVKKKYNNKEDKFLLVNINNNGSTVEIDYEYSD